MKALTWLAAALAITFAPATAAAGGYQIVVNPSNPAAAVPAAQLSRMFLKKLPKWDHGAAVVPVDQPAEAAVRAEFSKSWNSTGKFRFRAGPSPLLRCLRDSESAWRS